jgi:hypothetical protein
VHLRERRVPHVLIDEAATSARLVRANQQYDSPQGVVPWTRSMCHESCCSWRYAPVIEERCSLNLVLDWNWSTSAMGPLGSGAFGLDGPQDSRLTLPNWSAVR